MSARGVIKKNNKQVKTLHDNLDHLKTVIVVKLVAAGSYILGKDVFDINRE